MLIVKVKKCISHELAADIPPHPHPWPIRVKYKLSQEIDFVEFVKKEGKSSNPLDHFLFSAALPRLNEPWETNWESEKKEKGLGMPIFTIALHTILSLVYGRSILLIAVKSRALPALQKKIFFWSICLCPTHYGCFLGFFSQNDFRQISILVPKSNKSGKKKYFYCFDC